MTHAISITEEGQAEMFVAGKPAWHHLGQNVEKAVDWREAMKLAHLDWMVRKEQLTFDNTPVQAWGTFRADNKMFLGSVGPDYEPIQNKHAFDFVDTILRAEGKAHYESAGALFGGKKIWCLAKLPSEIRIKGTDDVSKTYLLFFNPHDGSRAAISKVTSTRVVCNNTLQTALRKEGTFCRIIHNKTTEEQFKAAKEFLLTTSAEISDLNSLLNALAGVKLDMPSMKKILELVYPKILDNVQDQNKARTILELYEDNDNNAFPSQRGTAYNLLNSFTKYTDHFASARLIVGEDETKARARKAMFGIGEVLKFQVLQTITKVCAENSLIKVNTNLF